MANSDRLVVFKFQICDHKHVTDNLQRIHRVKGVKQVTVDKDCYVTVVMSSGDTVEALRKMLKEKIGENVEILNTVNMPKPKIIIETVVLKVPMHCPGCVKRATEIIYQLKGVIKVEPGPVDGTLAVTAAGIEEADLLAYVKKRVKKFAEIYEAPPPPSRPAPPPPPLPTLPLHLLPPPPHLPSPIPYYPQRYHQCPPYHQSPCETMLSDENTSSCCVM